MSVYVMGDIHGSVEPIKAFLKRLPHKPTEDDVLILLGDVGFHYFLDKRDDRVKTEANNLGIKLFCIRGNHEQRPEIVSYIREGEYEMRPIFDSIAFVEKKYQNIYYALDFPHIYTILDKKTLVLPGAYSADKFLRLQSGKKWFPQEQMDEGDMRLAEEIVNIKGDEIELVMSHTCPISYEPADLFWSGIDQSMVDKTMERCFDSLERKLNYKLWTFGHFHDYRVYPRDGDKQMLMLSAGKEAIDLEATLSELEAGGYPVKI